MVQINSKRLLCDGGAASISSGLYIGSGADPGSTVTIGGSVLASGAGTHYLKWDNVSGVVTFDGSTRLIKSNIADTKYGLSAVMQLKPRDYYRIDDQRNEVGFIADEFLTVAPELVTFAPKSLFTKNEADVELIPAAVNYEKITAILTKAIQEQQQLIEALTLRVAELEAKANT